ncbi:hypothetical protein V6N13_105815 [Hibiscus sabdariffa]|uniref:Uncharacterized protein n=1 Tax=Hibiscus sabdariffa TaxID=183260 RepID=A0ABR2EYV2_9ROSI
MVIAGFHFWAFPPAILSLDCDEYRQLVSASENEGLRSNSKVVFHYKRHANVEYCILLWRTAPTYVSWTQIIDVVSSAFEGQSAVNRQRMVYKAIWEELQNAVDQMITQTPNEAASLKWKAFSPIFPTLKPHSFQ